MVELTQDVIRQFRAKVCFPVINRGQLWYSRLTDAERTELALWYEAWLNAPETMVIPKMPDFVNRKTFKEEILL